MERLSFAEQRLQRRVFSSVKFKIYRDKKKEFRWTLYAKNGRKIADSAEGYKRIGKCRREIENIMAGVTAEIIEP